MILKIILILNIIILFKNIITKNTKYLNLNCGLIGFCGSEPPNLLKIALLFKYNEKRGEHATGILYNNTIVKNLGSASKFLALNNELFNISKSKLVNNTVIGHTRQASVGSKDNLELAHPHAIEFENKPILWGAHNGTINNIEDLSHKYKIDHKSFFNSDSQTLFKILARVNDESSFSVLSEYGGYATLLFTPAKNKNTLYVHRDKDRELFYYQQDENNIYISSIEEALYAIGGNKTNVYEFDEHKVFKFVKGTLVKTFDLPKKVVYRKPYVQTRSQIKSNRTVNFNDYYDNRFPESLSKTAGRIKSQNCKIRAERPSNGFQWFKGRYYNNGHLYNGSIYLTADGSVILYKSDTKDQVYSIFYFIGGVMLKDENSYNTLKILCENDRKIFDTSIANKLDAFKFKNYAMYPIPTGLEQSIIPGLLLFISDDIANKNKSYTFQPILSNLEITVNSDGIITTTCHKNTVKNNKNSTTIITIKQAIFEVLKDSEKLYCYRDLVNAVNTILGRNANYAQIVEEFVNICVDDNIIDLIEANKITEEGGSEKLGTSSTLESMDTLLDKYIQYLNDINLENLIEFETIKDNSSFTLETSLSYYNNPNFHNTITDAQLNTIYDVLIEWSASDMEEDTYPIIIAAGHVLNDLGHISTEELELIKKSGIKPAMSIVKVAYNIYKSGLKGNNNVKEVNTPEEAIVYIYKNLKNTTLTLTLNQTKNLIATLQSLITNTKEVNYNLIKEKYNISEKELKDVLAV